MAAKGVGVVWLKRDLRLADHAPLAAAAASGLPLVVLYLYEPLVLSAVDFGRCHLDFINESLEEVQAALQALGASLVTRHGEAVGALAALHDQLAPAGGITRLWSHEETGTPAVTARNAAVAEWAKQAGVEWTELAQTGVTRNLASRDGWAKLWTQLMEAPLLPAPTQLRFATGLDPGRLMGAEELGVAGEAKPEAMKGGESRALVLLDSFLGGRAAGYSTNMSSPVTAWEGCSRLSPYLAWGCISLRTVHQRTKALADTLRAAKGRGGGKAAGGNSAGSKRKRRGKNAEACGGDGDGDEEEEEVEVDEGQEGAEGGDREGDGERQRPGAGSNKASGQHASAGNGAAGDEDDGGPPPLDGNTSQQAAAAVGLKDLAAFTARLRWRSHFMQKLEDQPDLVQHNMCRAYDGARNEQEPDRRLFEAWCQGRTGYPLVDAVVRCLLAGGWINFRMRAMIFSFASYHLWLHWRFTADFMAQHFIDYEPGIHYPQAQMQAGTTGINTFRVYSPSKQVADQDPQGMFIKKYVA